MGELGAKRRRLDEGQIRGEQDDDGECSRDSQEERPLAKAKNEQAESN